MATVVVDHPDTKVVQVISGQQGPKGDPGMPRVIQSQGVDQSPTRDKIDFQSAIFTVSDDSAGNRRRITLPSTFPPSGHNHVQGDVTGLSTTFATKQDTSAKGQANGYAGLDGTGKVPSGQLPPASASGITSLAGLTQTTISESELKSAANLDIGSDVQAWDAQLDSLAALTATAITRLATLSAMSAGSATSLSTLAADVLRCSTPPTSPGSGRRSAPSSRTPSSTPWRG